MVLGRASRGKAGLGAGVAQRLSLPMMVALRWVDSDATKQQSRHRDVASISCATWCKNGEGQRSMATCAMATSALQRDWGTPSSNKTSYFNNNRRVFSPTTTTTTTRNVSRRQHSPPGIAYRIIAGNTTPSLHLNAHWQYSNSSNDIIPNPDRGPQTAATPRPRPLPAAQDAAQGRAPSHRARPRCPLPAAPSGLCRPGVKTRPRWA